jgi:hypothetical protein
MSINQSSLSKRSKSGSTEERFGEHSGQISTVRNTNNTLDGTLGSFKRVEFLDQLRDCLFVKNILQ